MNYVIYHNPRCSKSRETLQLLKDSGIVPEVRLYLEDPPSKDELQALERLLDMPISEFTRKNETLYKGLAPSDNELIDVVAKNPILLERPIVIKDEKKAVIGRPPENIRILL